MSAGHRGWGIAWLAGALTACAPGPGRLDAGATDASTDADARVCADRSGLYGLSAAVCTPAGFSAPTVLCIVSTGCTARAWAQGDPLRGEDRDGVLELTGTESALRVGADGLATWRQVGAQCEPARLEPRPAIGVRRYCCDPSAQDCEPGERCVPVSAPDDPGTLVTACITGRANVRAPGTPCVPANGAVSGDACANGLWCTTEGVGATADPRGVCRTMCGAASPCAANEVCAPAGQLPVFGACVPACDAFAAVDPCGIGMRCGRASVLSAEGPSLALRCTSEGTTGEGARCDRETDCRRGLLCVPGGGTDLGRRCHRPCDTAHACRTGETCVPVPASERPLGFATLGTCRIGSG